MEKTNAFLNRGCKCSPKLYAVNEPIYDKGCCKFDVYDWISDVKSPSTKVSEFVEVRFKNNHKDIFKNSDGIKLQAGDLVAIEASPGHDVGIVTLTGDIVKFQMKKKAINPDSPEIKKIYRKAKPTDIDKWIQSTEFEDITLQKARKIAWDKGLNMKINDIEFQGDKTKAIFYYTANERVDFRELIRTLAEKFLVRIEMRQIGARQESSRIGGIGSCGRELCCSTWISKFKSVSTNNARNQQLSLNPQKLTGLCSKLKCCLNFENDWYLDALKHFPDSNIILKTKKGNLRFQKNDVAKKIMWFSYTSEDNSDIFALDIENVKIIISLNKDKILPENIEEYAKEKEKKVEFGTDITLEDLTKLYDKQEEEDI